MRQGVIEEPHGPRVVPPRRRRAGIVHLPIEHPRDQSPAVAPPFELSGAAAAVTVGIEFPSNDCPTEFFASASDRVPPLIISPISSSAWSGVSRASDDLTSNWIWLSFSSRKFSQLSIPTRQAS